MAVAVCYAWAMTTGTLMGGAVSEQRRAEHARWLFELTGLPTATGHEERVAAWVASWVAARPGLTLERDAAGNLTLRRVSERGDAPPLYFTAHLDHPAFVVEGVVAPGVIEAAFRGGVLAAYFPGARVVVHSAAGPLRGRVIEHNTAVSTAQPFTTALIELEGDATADGVEVGDIAVWDVGQPELVEGVVHAPACDDLAAVAAALGALDVLLDDPAPATDVRVLLTVAEEVGFIGAIAACKLGTMPTGARLLALENSRSMADSPIGEGPIVRVGDRLSTFSPTLTAAVARVAQLMAGQPERRVGDAGGAPAPAFKWQRKLMPGGACEATAFMAYAYDATCICLPLGNYHNMAELDRVQAETNKGAPGIEARIEREFISLADFQGLVELLVACGRELPASEPLMEKMEKLYAERSFVLGGHNGGRG